MRKQDFLTIMAKGTDREVRMLAQSLCSRAVFVRRFLTAMPDRELADVKERERVWRQFFAGTISFTASPSSSHYGRTHPDLAALGHLLDENEANLVHQLRDLQNFEPLRTTLLGTPPGIAISREVSVLGT